ncbi:YobI family P-loop NTPase [Flavobacterium phycosphaerae]|uniref:YobI family P-loop NTPase n=1 Tax=Flavobacterium phycosphaerae TaxID=2697515 RepID=UPI00138A5645|nr:hypothetical protein [Flavobacterium phycosphaerae]
MEENNLPVKIGKNKFSNCLIICCVSILNSVKTVFARRLNRIESKLGYPFNKNPKSFDDLTPTIIKNEVTYTSALFWALKNKNIKNIALTGSYGSGKSSIIKTFKNRHVEFDYLNISLATFEDIEDNDVADGEKSKVKLKTKEQKEERDSLNHKIELSILQQMLYIEKSSKLPNSRFKRIKNFKKHNVYLNTFFVFITALGYIFLFQREMILKVCLTYNFFIVNADILELFSGILMVIGIFFLLRAS